MKKLFALFPLLCLPLFAAQPNVPLYVHWDGTIAAPTQFLSATFKAGANMVFVDNRTNLTIAATTGVGSNSVVIIPGTNIVVTTNITGTNITYTVSTSTGVGSNSVVVAPGTSVTVATNVTATNVIYTVSSTVTDTGGAWISQMTNPAYVTNMIIDLSVTNFPIWNLMGLTNHINLIVTNGIAAQSFTILVHGASTEGNPATNFNIYWTWNTGWAAYWLGYTTNIVVTSNKIAAISGFIPAANRYVISGRE